MVTSSDVAFALAPTQRVSDENFRQKFAAIDSSTRALNAIGEALYLKMPISGVQEMIERRAGASLPISVYLVEDGAVFFSFIEPQGQTKYFKCFLANDNVSSVGATLLKLPDGREYWREEIGRAGQSLKSTAKASEKVLTFAAPVISEIQITDENESTEEVSAPVPAPLSLFKDALIRILSGMSGFVKTLLKPTDVLGTPYFPTGLEGILGRGHVKLNDVASAGIDTERIVTDGSLRDRPWMRARVLAGSVGSEDADRQLKALAVERSYMKSDIPEQDLSPEILKSFESIMKLTEPRTVAFAIGMYKEERRMRPYDRDDNPLGENSLRVKVRQLQALHRINPFFEWKLFLVDDGTPGNSSAECAAKLWENIKEEYRLRSEPLSADQVEISRISPEDKARMKSKKGGAVLLGMRAALSEGFDYIGYTDVDISTDLRQTGLLLDPLENGEVDAAVGSRWIKGGRSEKVPFLSKISSRVYNLCVQAILPPLKGIRDTQRAFKLFKRGPLTRILTSATDNSFAFDTELLLLARLNGYEIQEVPIHWVDSHKASTLNTPKESIKMLIKLFEQRRHMAEVSLHIDGMSAQIALALGMKELPEKLNGEELSLFKTVLRFVRLREEGKDAEIMMNKQALFEAVGMLSPPELIESELAKIQSNTGILEFLDNLILVTRGGIARSQAEEGLKHRLTSYDEKQYAEISSQTVKIPYEHILISAVPTKGRTLEEQMDNLLSGIDKALKENGCDRDSVFRQVIFLRNIADKDKCREIMGAHYGRAPPPATSYIIQAPAKGELLSIEVMAIPKSSTATVEKVSGNVAIVKDSGIKWAYISGLEPDSGINDTREQAAGIFARMRTILAENGFKFENILRTWIYQGHITDLDEDGQQRYDKMNEPRWKLFTTGDAGTEIKFLKDFLRRPLKEGIFPYPASTGIGMNDGTFVMECVAVSTDRNDVEVIPLENPRQTSVYNYDKEELFGKKINPAFSRGMALITAAGRWIFVSGTASIIKGKTIGTDAAVQTEEAVENIRLVLNEADAGLADIAQIRVYVKNQSDYEKVRNILDARFGKTPRIDVIAGVCRQDLLVEIEAIAYAKNPESAITDTPPKIKEKNPLEQPLDGDVPEEWSDRADRITKVFADIGRMDLMLTAYQEILSDRGKELWRNVAVIKNAFTEGDFSRTTEARSIIGRMPDPKHLVADENDPENWINWFDLKNMAVLHMPLGYGCRQPCQQCLAGNGVFLSRNLPLPIAIKAIKPHNFGNWSRNELFDWYDPFFKTSIDSLMEYAIRKDDTAHFIITTAGWPKWDRRAQEAAERIKDFDINPTLGTSGFNVSFHLGQPYYDIVRATYEHARSGGSMTEPTEEELSRIAAPYIEHYANILGTLSPHLRHIYFCYTKEPSFYNLVSTYAFKKALEKADWNSFDLTVNVTRSIEGVEPDDTREFLVYQDLHDAESDEAIGRSADFLKRLELAEKGDPACLKVDPVVITDRIAPKTKYPLISISHNGDVKVESHIDGRVLARTSIGKSDSHFSGQASLPAGFDERFEMKGDGGDTSEEDLNRLEREAAKPPAAAVEQKNISRLILPGDVYKRIIKSIAIVASAILVLYLYKDWYLALAQASLFWRISENLIVGGISCGLGMYVNQTIRGERYDWGKIARWTAAGGAYLGLIVYGGWFWLLTTYMPNIFWRVFVDVTLFFAIIGLPVNFFIHKYIVSLNKEKVDWRQTLSHSLRLYAFHCAFWGIGLYIGWSYFEEQIVLTVAALSIVWRGVFIYFLDSWVKTAHGPPGNSGDTKEKGDSHFSGQASLPDGYDERFEMKGDGGDTSEEDLNRLDREKARAAAEDGKGTASYNKFKEQIRLYLIEGSDDRIDDIIKSIDFSIKTEDSAYMIAATFDILGTLAEEKKTQERLLILSKIIRQADPASEKPADKMAREAAIAFFKTVDEGRQFQNARDKELAAIEFIKGGGRRQGAAESYDLKVKTFGLLTRVGEICLASRARLGDSSAVNKLIETNLGLVEIIAGKYVWPGIEFLDLVSVGNNGLRRAIEKYDPSLGNKFSTYAKWWIRATINRWIDNNRRNIRIPVPVLEKLEAFRKACRDHVGQNGALDPIDRFDDDISDKKLAEAIDWPEETVTEMRRIMYETQSLSDPRIGSDGENENESEGTREGTIGEYDKGLEYFEREDLLEYITQEVKKVYEVRRKDWDKRARIIFEERILPIFWLKAPIICDEVARKLGVTPQYVNLIEMRLRRAMRRVLEREGVTSADFIGPSSNDRLINGVKEKGDSHFSGQASLPDGYDERFEMKGDGGDTSEEDLKRLELEAAKPPAAEIVRQIKEASWMGAINLKDADLEVRRAVIRELSQLETKELIRVGALKPGWEPNKAFRLLDLSPEKQEWINNDAVEITFSKDVLVGIGRDLKESMNIFRMRVEGGAASLSILNKDGSEIASRPIEINSKKPYTIARSSPNGDPYRIMTQDPFASSKKHFAFRVVKDGNKTKLLIEDESTNGTCILIPKKEIPEAPVIVSDKKAEPKKHIVIVRKGSVVASGNSHLDNIIKRKGPVQPGEGDTAWEMVADEGLALNGPSQQTQAETLANKIKIYASEAKSEKTKVIVGIETAGWVPDEQKSDMQALTSEVRQLVDTLKRRGVLDNITVVLGNSETLLSNIAKEQSGKSDKIVVLGSEKTLTSGDYKALEAFKACIDLRELGNLDYISLLEMLTVALNLGLGGETSVDSLVSHPDIAIETIGERIVRLIPSKCIDINEPSKVYQLQIKELAKQA